MFKYRYDSHNKIARSSLGDYFVYSAGVNRFIIIFANKTKGKIERNGNHFGGF